MRFNILFITQDDPFYVRLFFEAFFKSYEALDAVKGVVIAKAMGKKSIFQLARQMFDFYGPIDFLRMGLKYAFHKLMAHAPALSLKNRSYSLTQLCHRHDIEVIHEENINGELFRRNIEGKDLDLIISVAAPMIFKSDLIRLPKYGCINIHSGKLPKYRGMLPNFWQMYYGEKSVGITIHEINPGIDDGRIVLQKEVAIAQHQTLEALIERTKRIGAEVMIEAIDLIKSGNVVYKENPVSEGSYFSFPTRKDVIVFKRRGGRIM